MSDCKDSSLVRRDFLKLGGTAAAGIIAGSAVSAPAHALPPLPDNPETPNAMPTRNLGKTGYRVGVFSLGGQASVEKANNEAVAVPIVERRPRSGRELRGHGRVLRRWREPGLYRAGDEASA